MSTFTSLARVATLASVAVVVSSLGVSGPAAAMEPGAAPAATCDPVAPGASARSADRTLRGVDHENLSVADVARIERRIDRALERRGSARVGARVPVRMHVIDGRRYRGPSKADARDQLKTMNKAYSGGQSPDNAGTNVSFFLKSFDRVKNQRWLTAGVNQNTGKPDADSKQMRSRLHKGGPATLNMYFSKPGHGLLGYSSFPWKVDKNRSQDGVTIHSESLRGGSINGYNRGDTAVHEVGHWLGLLHTFQGGCSEPNDGVADTPQEAEPAFECTARNTCAAPGNDPIRNFMDYGYDTCMNRFTDGQSTRIDEAWSIFRTP